jgi:PleD family two-component response regulator
MAKQYKLDLILMGVYTPKMIGYEACRAIKADISTSLIPVILLSEKGEEFEDQAFKQEGE